MSTEKICITGYGALHPEMHAKSFNGHHTAVSTLAESIEKELRALRAEKRSYSKLDRSVLLAILAARKATKNREKTGSIGVNISSSRGATGTFEQALKLFNESQTVPITTSPMTTLGNVSSWVLQDCELDGFATSHSMTCSSALFSVANAYAWMQAGMCDRFLAGGTEAPLTDFTVAQMKALGIYTTDTDSALPSRPLNKEEKNTFVLGEGAAIFLLEKALTPPSECFAIIESVGYGSEQTSSPTSISDDGHCFQKSMRRALAQQRTKKDIDLILMHAPGTVHGDRAELTAIKAVFNQLPALYSNKYLYGHTLAAAGALNIATALTLFQEKKVPKLPYASILSESAREVSSPVQKILINAAGFGGVAASVVLSTPELFTT